MQRIGIDMVTPGTTGDIGPRHSTTAENEHFRLSENIVTSCTGRYSRGAAGSLRHSDTGYDVTDRQDIIEPMINAGKLSTPTTELDIITKDLSLICPVGTNTIGDRNVMRF